MQPLWYGKIHNGNFYPNQPDHYLSYLANLNDCDVQLTVEKKNKRRSNQQNRYGHGVLLKQLSEHTGFTVTELKELAKKDLGLVRYVERKNGAMVELTRSSATFTTTEWEQFMVRLRQMGDEAGIYINEPL